MVNIDALGATESALLDAVLSDGPGQKRHAYESAVQHKLKVSWQDANAALTRLIERGVLRVDDEYNVWLPNPDEYDRRAGEVVVAVERTRDTSSIEAGGLWLSNECAGNAERAVRILRYFIAKALRETAAKP